MKYLLDTDTLIDVLEDRDGTRPLINTMIEAGDEVALCVITVAELYSGLNQQRRAKWEKWLMALPYWQISREAAKQAGIYRKTASRLPPFMGKRMDWRRFPALRQRHNLPTLTLPALPPLDTASFPKGERGVTLYIDPDMVH